jgi:hypothetical protein
VVFHGRTTGALRWFDWARFGPNGLESYGTGASGAGDVNGDGYDDLIFSACSLSSMALLYLGSSSGLATSPAWSVTVPATSSNWPLPATGAGDVNGDGYADVIVGVRTFNGGAAAQGRALVYHGAAGGLPATPSWTATGAVGATYLGFSVDGAGDVDGDHYDDVLVATKTEARLYRGSPSGLATTPAWTTPIQPYMSGGSKPIGEVAGAGDVDGDGYDDVLVASTAWSNGQSLEGRVQLFRGSATGLSAMPAWTVESDRAEAFFGFSVDGAGDTNADGYDDVVISEDAFYRGRVSLFLGGPGGLAATPAWFFTGPTPEGQLGQAVRGAGDVDGDGRDDVIAGSPAMWEIPGSVFLFLGVQPDWTGPAASVPEAWAQGLRHQPLHVETYEGDMYLSWGLSCALTESDWEVYEGVLGDFTSHVPVFCSTDGARWTAFPPSPGNRYYLVVPRTLDREGGYGSATSGPRPASASACLPQSLASCP